MTLADWSSDKNSTSYLKPLKSEHMAICVVYKGDDHRWIGTMLHLKNKDNIVNDTHHFIPNNTTDGHLTQSLIRALKYTYMETYLNQINMLALGVLSTQGYHLTLWRLLTFLLICAVPTVSIYSPILSINKLQLTSYIFNKCDLHFE